MSVEDLLLHLAHAAHNKGLSLSPPPAHEVLGGEVQLAAPPAGAAGAAAGWGTGGRGGGGDGGGGGGASVTASQGTAVTSQEKVQGVATGVALAP
jgi:hypothetical protein